MTAPSRELGALMARADTALRDARRTRAVLAVSRVRLSDGSREALFRLCELAEALAIVQDEQRPRRGVSGAPGDGAVDSAARVVVGSVWSCELASGPSPSATVRAFGVVISCREADGRVDCVLLRLDRRLAKTGEASAVLEGWAYVGRAAGPFPSNDVERDVALVSAALALVCARPALIP